MDYDNTTQYLSPLRLTCNMAHGESMQAIDGEGGFGSILRDVHGEYVGIADVFGVAFCRVTEEVNLDSLPKRHKNTKYFGLLRVKLNKVHVYTLSVDNSRRISSGRRKSIANNFIRWLD